MDDISGKTPQRNEYKRLMAAHHARAETDGSRLLRKVESVRIAFGSLEDPLRFVNSAYSEMVQIADLVSYNVYRQFREHGDEWEDGSSARTLPTYPYFQRIVGKFLCDPENRLQVYGTVTLVVGILDLHARRSSVGNCGCCGAAAGRKLKRR